MNSEATATTDPEKEEGYVEQQFDFQPIDHHEWRQEGNMIRCTSCLHPHGSAVEQGLVLSKTPEGKFTLTREY